MKKYIEIVTPERAEELLISSPSNRHLSEGMVHEMLEDLNNGTFNKEEANVCLSKDGKLFYGQHILNAVVRYGKEVELCVYRLEENDKNHGRGKLNDSSKYRYTKAPKEKKAFFMNKRVIRPS